MKYSEYLQLRELLESHGVTIEEFKKDPALYEGVLSTLGKGLWTLAKKGMKVAVSKGISANKKEELNKAATDIRKWILDEVKKGEDESHPLYKTLQNKKAAKETLEKDPSAKTAAGKRAKQTVRLLDKELAKFLRKKVDIKVKSIEQKITKNDNLTDDDKEALKEYWDDLSINLEISISEALSDADIIEEDTTEDWLRQLQKVTKMRTAEEKPETQEKKAPEKRVKSQKTPAKIKTT